MDSARHAPQRTIEVGHCHGPFHLGGTAPGHPPNSPRGACHRSPAGVGGPPGAAVYHAYGPPLPMSYVPQRGVTLWGLWPEYSTPPPQRTSPDPLGGGGGGARECHLPAPRPATPDGTCLGPQPPSQSSPGVRRMTMLCELWMARGGWQGGPSVPCGGHGRDAVHPIPWACPPPPPPKQRRLGGPGGGGGMTALWAPRRPPPAPRCCAASKRRR